MRLGWCLMVAAKRFNMVAVQVVANATPRSQHELISVREIGVMPMKRCHIIIPCFTILMIATGLAAPAAPLGYWRFENGGNLGQDASGNGLDLTAINNPVTTNLVGATGAGQNFFTNGIPQTGQSNTLAVRLNGNNCFSGSGYPAFTNMSAGQLTVEAFINAASVPAATTVPIASQYEQGGSPQRFQWILALRTDANNVIRPRVTINGASSTVSAICTNLSVSLNTDYYLAMVYNTNGTATIYLQYATASLQTEVLTNLPTGILQYSNTNAPFRIGAFRSAATTTNYFSGLIDEVRVSTSALNVSNLLVSSTVPPSIVTSTHNISVGLGDNATFNVVAGGSSPLYYKWYSNGVPAVLLQGGTNLSSLVLTNVQLAQSGSAYYVVVTNSYGSVTSTPPAILTVVDTSGPTAGYWRFENGGNLGQDASGNGLDLTAINNPVSTNLVGATGAGRNFFTNGIPQTGQSNTLAVRLNGNNCLSGNGNPGFANMSSRQLTVEALINAASVPAATTVPIASQWEQGGSPQRYQWIFALRSDTNNIIRPRVTINGASGTVSAICTNLSVSVNTDYYLAMVYDTNGTATIYLRLLENGPLQTELLTGLPINILQYGETNAPFRIGAFRSGNTTTNFYTGVLDEVRVSGDASSLWLYNGPPIISNDPQSGTNLTGTPRSFKVTVRGVTPFSYQWYHNGVAIAGATNDSCRLPAVQTSDAGNYQVSVSNIYGATISQIATLEVRKLPTYYYVSGTGNDTNSGTNVSAPFLTIQRAATVMIGGDICFIRAGTYRETVVPSASGYPVAPITFTNYNGEAAVVSGADVLTPQSVSVYTNNIYQAAVTNVFSQLFIDGNMMNIARWPNAQINDLVNAARASVNSTVSSNTDLVCTELPNLDLAGATIQIFPGTPGYEWAANTRTITNYSPNSHSLSWAVPTSYNIQPHNPFYLFGILALLDAPGEWYLDTNDGLLYIWAPGNDSLTNHVIETKSRSEAFVLDNRSNIAIGGIYVFGAGISMQNSINCTVDGCHLRYIQHNTSADWSGVSPQAACGVSGSSNTWANADITYSSQDGLLLKGISQTVTNCVIRQAGYYPGGYYSAVTVYGTNNHIVGNTLTDSGRSLVNLPTVGGCEIAGNDMRRGLQRSRDGGAVYTYASNGGRTTVHHNWISDCQVGVYLDSGSSNYIVYKNVCSNGRDGVYLNSPSYDNVIYNNTLIDSFYSINLGAIQSGVQIINNLINTPTILGSSATTNKNGWYPPIGIDFEPQSGSGAIDAGITLSPFTDGYIGAAPDIGAYEVGASNWLPGSTMTVPVFPGVAIYPPPNFRAVNGSGQVSLSWLSVDGASSYNVKRAASSGGPYTTIATGLTGGSAEGIQYTNTGLFNGTNYYYVVSASNGAAESGESMEVATLPAAIVDDASSMIEYSSGWTQSSDTNFYAGTKSEASAPGRIAQLRFFGSGIQVFARKAPSNGMLDVYIDNLMTVLATNVDTYSVASQYQQLVYENTNLSAGCHVIRIVLNGQKNTNSSGNYIDFDYFNIVASNQPPDAPSGLEAISTNAAVNLSWQAVNNTLSYNVKRSPTIAGPFIPVSSTTNTNYADNGLTNGVLYYYAVSAFNSGGESSNSASASARPISTIPVLLNYTICPDGLWMSWPADHIGWRLQAQTNSLQSGLGTNWTDIHRELVLITNQVLLPLGSANGSVFLRLIYP